MNERSLRVGIGGLVALEVCLLVGSLRGEEGGAPPLASGETGADSLAAFEGRRQGLLRTISIRDGSVRDAHDLESPPVWDGLAAAGGCVYVSREDGALECLSGER